MKTTDLIIRRSTDADRAALRRLATLDSGEYHGEPMLVAVQAGELVAAVPIGYEGRPFADPFVRTAGVVELLLLRAAQLRAESASPTVRSIVRRTSHALAAAIATR